MAFKEAYTNEVSQQNSGISNITNGVSSALGTAIGAGALATQGLGNVATGLAGRFGGFGGQAVVSLFKEKTDTAKMSNERKGLISKEQINNTLGSNPINNTAKKQLSTVFEMLSNKNLTDKQGNIETSIGKVDPTSPLGQLIGKKVLDND